jgi:glycosyltransferase involved in cell wall biosynthesis
MARHQAENRNRNRTYPIKQKITPLAVRKQRLGPRKILRSYEEEVVEELANQAKYFLQQELMLAWTENNIDQLIVFFSFTDGLSRATVIHFKGQDLNDIWSRFSNWRSQNLKKGQRVRWLRIDWVINKHNVSWGECSQEIERYKRNYFRYGISLDHSFRRAFLEQELNANAMLYLGNNQSNSGVNEKNFVRYGKKKYGKLFQMPTDPDSEVVIFSTQAILAQPTRSCTILHGYCGGLEGRNTGRRIIHNLREDCVKELVDLSSQYLADQVDITGKFIYGLHPCFDKEIPTYNTLRHASTTYSMLEALEVTGNADLKSAIERSISHLTSKLIHQHRLESGDTVSYLHDMDNEIKLGGNAVCLLALVKYTELTTDQSYLPLMEQLALGIIKMQDTVSGQFSHVLNAYDLTIKEQFRIVYYDGEAAFGLVRLFGLTKDERWLNSVEKAFDYFIANNYWEIHDHWLGYCVNELTIYRPSTQYYEFGIKNFMGHLDFVIERITTYPTLLELMMASHQMICRLRSDRKYQHLLNDVDIEKFYHALDTRAHYLLNGFFWPEFAMFFQNPQRILGSFFIRHHSFRVRIDDVEHYLSGYVAYLRKFLPCLRKSQVMDSPQEPEPSFKSNDLSIRVFFLNQDMGDYLTGIEHSAITRALLFNQDLGIKPTIVTSQYRPFLSDNIEQHLKAKGCLELVDVLGLYDYVQGFERLQPHTQETKSSLHNATEPTFDGYQEETVPGYKDIRYRDKSGRLFAYKVYSKIHGRLTHINYFSNGKKIAADIFRSCGHKCSHRIYEAGTLKTICEIYYNSSAQPIFYRIFDHSSVQLSPLSAQKIGFHLADRDAHKITPMLSEDDEFDPSEEASIDLIGLNALIPLIKKSQFIGGDADFSAWALDQIVADTDDDKIALVCDKNKSFFVPAVKVRNKYNLNQASTKSLRLISMIHSTHYKGLSKDSDIKSHYRDLLSSEYDADQIIVLTQSQGQDIIERFPGKNVAAIAHTIINKQDNSGTISHAQENESPKAIYVARLSPEKNHIMAIDMFASILKTVPHARLHFYGEGPERSLIESHINKLGIGDSIILEGYQSDVSEIYNGLIVQF